MFRCDPAHSVYSQITRMDADEEFWNRRKRRKRRGISLFSLFAPVQNRFPYLRESEWICGQFPSSKAVEAERSAGRRTRRSGRSRSPNNCISAVQWLSTLLKYPIERRVGARGLHYLLGNHGSCRPGALTGLVFQEAVRHKMKRCAWRGRQPRHAGARVLPNPQSAILNPQSGSGSPALLPGIVRRLAPIGGRVVRDGRSWRTTRG